LLKPLHQILLLYKILLI